MKRFSAAASKAFYQSFPWMVAIATFAAFSPAMKAKFINLDDLNNYVWNGEYRGLGIANLKWMFFTYQLGGVHQPLVWITHALDYKIWGVDPFGFHLTNVMLHSLAAAVFYFLALNLLKAALPVPFGQSDKPWRWSALFSTLFFSLHPLRVEVVAWVSDRNYVLPGLFFLIALWTYTQALRTPSAGSRRWYWLGASILAFILSILSKAIGMALPLFLLLLDNYPYRRLGGKEGWLNLRVLPVWLEKIPYFVIAIFGGIIAAKGRYAFGAMVPLSQFGLASRLGQAFFGVIFYLEKTVLPVRLAALYSLPASLSPFDRLCFPRTLLVVSITSFVVFNRRRWPALLAAWTYHMIALLPFLGLSQYGFMLEIAADKWCHLASVGWAVLAGGGLLVCWEKAQRGTLGRSAFQGVACGAGLVLAALGAMSWRQCWVWHDSESLYTASIASDPDCYHCRSNLAAELLPQGRYDEVIALCKEALRLKPGYILAERNLSAAYRGKGMAAETVELPIADMLSIPHVAEVHHALAKLLAAKGKLDDAINVSRAAVMLEPNNAQAHCDFSILLNQGGLVDEAMFEARAAIEANPNLAQAHFNLGYFYHTRGMLSDAESQYREAVRLDPKNPNAFLNLGLILHGEGKSQEAASYCQRAYQLDPAHDNPLCKRN